MDALAVRAATAEAVAAARGGAGPTLLEFKTYRFTGHSRSDARGYRSSDEEQAWESRDPLTLLAPALGDGEGEQIEADVQATLDDAVEFARSSPFPEPDDAFTDVYA